MGGFMKKISISIMALAVLAILMISPAAQASLTEDIRYSETALGAGLWQYDFVIENKSSAGDFHPYLWKVSLDFEESAYVTLLNKPENWTVGTFTGSLPGTTDYVQMYSDAIGFDVLPGALLAGLSFTADYQLGKITYEAWFSDHGTPEDWVPSSGTASAVPIPAAVWLLGSGLAGIVGIRRRLGR
jgi:hypothetical protein